MMYNPIVANTKRLIPIENTFFHWHLNRCMKFRLFLNVRSLVCQNKITSLITFANSKRNKKWLVEFATTVAHVHAVAVDNFILFIRNRCSMSMFDFFIFIFTYAFAEHKAFSHSSIWFGPSVDSILTNDCAWTILSTTDSLFITTYLAYK